MKLLFATTNPHKAREVGQMLGPLGIELCSLAEIAPGLPEPVEDADTFEGNARIKAVAYARALGMSVLADDSGLEVDALGGAPGVDSAYFAGPDATYADNRRKLLAELDGVPAEQRGAAFVTVALARWPDGREVVVRGECRGTIATSERGDNGFGYDPLFIPDEGDGRTFGEMSDDEKHELSHRGRAFRALLAALDQGS